VISLSHTARWIPSRDLRIPACHGHLVLAAEVKAALIDLKPDIQAMAMDGKSFGHNGLTNAES